MISESQRKAAWVIENNLRTSYQSHFNATSGQTQRPTVPGLPPVQGVYIPQAAASNILGCPTVPPAAPPTVFLAGNTAVPPVGVPVASPTGNLATPPVTIPAASLSGNPASPIGRAGRPAMGSKPIKTKTKGRMQRWFRPNKP